MTTGAFSRNIGKLFSELKLVSDNLLFNDLRIWCGDEGKVLQPCLYRAHFPEKELPVQSYPTLHHLLDA